jgi:hypothetical protein
VTLSGSQNLNGTVTQIGGTNGLTSKNPCVPGLDGQPAMIDLSDNSQLSFVTDSGGTELQFILTRDTSSGGKTANNVRIGVCRKQ